MRAANSIGSVPGAAESGAGVGSERDRFVELAKISPRLKTLIEMIARAKQLGIPAVLGSATPSLESYAQAIQGRYQLLEMRERAVPGARLPEIGLIDLRHVPVENGLTRPVRQALMDNHARGEQSLVFLNRRGYAPAMYCSSWPASQPSTCQRSTR